MSTQLSIDRLAYVALVGAIAACHGGELRMVTAQVEPDLPPDAGAVDASSEEAKRISCDDDVRPRKCNDIGCPAAEGSILESCGILRRRLRPSAFNRYVECAVEKVKAGGCDLPNVDSCLDFPEGRCIDPQTRNACENALRSCNAAARPRKRRPSTKMTLAQCQAVLSAVQPRARSMFVACMNESCDFESARDRCILE